RVACQDQPGLAARMVAAAAPPAARDAPALAGERAGGARVVCPLVVSAQRPAGVGPGFAPPHRWGLAARWPALLAPLASLCASAGPALAGAGASWAASWPAGGRYAVGAVGGRREGAVADADRPVAGGQ